MDERPAPPGPDARTSDPGSKGARVQVDIGGCRLHVVEAAPRREGAPVLLMLHGGPGFDHTGFRPEFDRYADRLNVIYVDQRGQGQSDRSTPDHWCLDVWADDVVRLCAALDVERPIVFGQSFGGMVAMHYAARHPSHARALVFSSTSAHMHLHERVLPAFEAAGGARALRAATAFFEAPDPDRWPAYARHCLPLYNVTPQSGPPTPPRFDVLCHFFAGEAFTMDLRPGLADVVAPVLVTVGEEDPITPQADAHDIVDALHAAPVREAVFRGAGHGVWRDRAADFFAVFENFLEEVA